MSRAAWRAPGLRPLAAALLLAAATAAVFSGVAGHEFLQDYDDEYYVTENPEVLRGLTPGSLRWAFTTTYAAFWHPLTWVSHMLDVQLFGPDPAAHHVVAAVLHLAAALGLFLALRALTGRTWASWLVAGLFAVHPLHVESVAWVSERKDLLCALFWFLAVGAHAWYARSPRPARYAAVCAAYLAALMSKSMAVTLPFTLLLLDFWPLGRLRRFGPGAAPAPVRRLVWLEKVPLLAAIPAIAALSYAAQRDFAAIAPWLQYDLGHRLANALLSYGAYLGNALAPARLAAYYPHPGVEVPWAKVAAGAAVLAAGTAACARLVRAAPFLAAGWLWYLGTLVPVVGIVQVGQFARADRYSYVPLVGVFVAAVWGVAALCERLGVPPSRRAMLAAACLTAFGAMARVQSGYWRDEVALWTRAVEVTGENVHARVHLGAALLRRGDPGRAAAQLREALRINPNVAEAMELLASALERLGEHEEAARQRAGARALERAFAAARAVAAASPPQRAGFAAADFNDAGVGEDRRGNRVLAEAHFRRALALAPGDAAAHYNLGSLLLRLDRPEEALAEFARAAALAPELAGAHLGVGVVLARRGDAAGARAAFERALAADPGLAEARARLDALTASGR